MSTKSEKIRNLAETTLASGYTAGSGSLSVTSAGDFPTDGDFTVRLDNVSQTILRVSAVSGTTFTVTAEENDGNASAGDAVILATSRTQGERYLQRPLTGQARSPYGADGALFLGPFQNPVTALSQSSWSWVNQGSFAYSESAGFVHITGPAAAGTNIRGRFKTAPSVPYTIEMGVIHMFHASTSGPSQLQFLGLAFRESGTGEITVFVFSNFSLATAQASPTIAAANYNSATSFNASIGTERFLPGMPQLCWLRMTDNNTNLIFEYSFDRVNWFQIASIGRTSFMAGAPDQVGWIATDQGGSQDFAGTIVSWVES